MDAQKRNRYLDAMGVDVWVRRPGGALEGVWVEPAAALVGASPDVVVEHAAADVAPEATSVAAPAEFNSAPVIARAPAQPAAVGDEAARWEALRTEVLSCTK